MSESTTHLEEGECYVALTHDHLDAKAIMDRVRSPKAGAIVLFAGTTRDNFEGKPVQELQYSSYGPRALKTMLDITKAVLQKHSLTSIAMIHRLGVVPIAEESILIAVSSPHRQAAWRAGEEALEECKAKVEVWKREEFGGDEGGVWRANRDGAKGVPVSHGEKEEPRGESAPKEKPDDGAEKKRHILNPPRPKPPFERGHGPVVHHRKTDEEN